MRYFIPFLLIFAIGCTSMQSTANKRLTSTVLSVQSAHAGWERWACNQTVTPQQVAEVRLATAKYEVALNAAQGAYLTLGSTGDTNAWQKACGALKVSSESLLELIHSYTTEAYGDAVVSTNLNRKPL